MVVTIVEFLKRVNESLKFHGGSRYISIYCYVQGHCRLCNQGAEARLEIIEVPTPVVRRSRRGRRPIVLKQRMTLAHFTSHVATRSHSLPQEEKFDPYFHNADVDL